MVHKITLMEAYLIETARKAGVSNEEMLSKAEQQDLESLNNLHENFDFTELYPLVGKEGNVFKEILEEGYKIKFLTFPGLVNLLKLKFDKVKDKDFIVEEFSIKELQLTELEIENLKTWISTNWKVEEVGKGLEIKRVRR
ncbi:hypothetical protein [Pseudogracilibacillus sp. SO30301A]|uniref:hypothetical protein n=1 Tax=Pseudogracilibacillus sp. SO30301A TaxID=3098291 RepID=UPI00300DD2E2